MKKKLVSFGMAAMMAASLAACGGSKPAETTAAADNAETTAAEGAETEAAAEGGTLKVGIIGPLTGAGAAYGNAVANGAELAAKEINEAGGINGMMIETKAEDDENDPEKSINAYNTLKDWGMQVLDGPTTSKPCIAVGAEAESDNMFLILFDLAFTAQSGGINKDILRFVVYDLGIDRITGSTRNVGNDHAVLAQQLINNRRLSYVRLTDDGYLRTVILLFL